MGEFFDRWWPRRYVAPEPAAVFPSSVDPAALPIVLSEVVRQSDRQSRAFDTLATIATALLGFSGVTAAIFAGQVPDAPEWLMVGAAALLGLAVLLALWGIALQSRTRPGLDAVALVPTLSAESAENAQLVIAAQRSVVIHRAEFDLRRVRTLVYLGLVAFTLGWLLLGAGFVVSAFDEPDAEIVRVIVCDGEEARCE